jgi:hypothetical protein
MHSKSTFSKTERRKSTYQTGPVNAGTGSTYAGCISKCPVLSGHLFSSNAAKTPGSKSGQEKYTYYIA